MAVINDRQRDRMSPPFHVLVVSAKTTFWLHILFERLDSVRSRNPKGHFNFIVFEGHRKNQRASSTASMFTNANFSCRGARESNLSSVELRRWCSLPSTLI